MAPEWQVSADGKIEKIGPVELGKTYVAPQNSEVAVTFTTLPEIPGTLSIEEITLTLEQVKTLGALSNKAYDITSDMKEGTFIYNLSLPIPDSSKGKAVEVKFAEEISNIDSAEKVENILTNTNASVSVENLNHFTIFVVVNLPPPPTNQIGNIFDNDNGSPTYVESGTWLPSGCVGYHDLTTRYANNGAGDSTATWTFTVPATGRYQVYVAWGSHSNRGDAVKYTVNSDDTAEPVTINQQSAVASCAWSDFQTLGTIHNFTSGTSYTVTLSNNTAGGAVSADAIKILSVDDPSVVYVDDDWSGAIGSPVTVGSNTYYMGFNAFSKIQDAISGVVAGGMINVAAGTYNESLDISKPLTILGAGQATTFIDQLANASAGNVVYIHGASGDVKVDGFTIRTGPASSVASSGIVISDVTTAGTTTISNNTIWAVQSASGSVKDNMGLYAHSTSITTSKLVFDHNTVHGGGGGVGDPSSVGNPILIEKWMGSTEITSNNIDQGSFNVSASDVIFMMNYGGSHNNAKQLISDNTIDMGWGTTYDSNHRGVGISIAGSYYGTGAGGFTDIEISNNHIINLKPSRRGISTWNNSNNGTDGAITSAVISGNIISNATGYTGEFGIRDLGKNTGTQITNNTISGVIDAVKMQDWNGSPSGVVVHHNSLVATTFGVNNLTTNIVDATNNWWGNVSGPLDNKSLSGTPNYNNLSGTGSPVTSYVNYKPWCTDLGCTTFSSDNPATTAATVVTSTTATLNGIVGTSNADNTSFWWGTSPASSFTSAVNPSSQLGDWSHDTGLGAKSASAPFSHDLTGLTPGTTYHFVVWSFVDGTWYPGAILSFKTADKYTQADFKAFDGVGKTDIPANQANGYTFSSGITATYTSGNGTEGSPVLLTLTGYAPIVIPWFWQTSTTYNWVTIGIKLPLGFVGTSIAGGTAVSSTGVMRYNSSGTPTGYLMGDGDTPLATTGDALHYLDFSFGANREYVKNGLVFLEVIWNTGDTPEYFTIDVTGLQLAPDVPTATLTADGDNIPTNGYTNSETFTFNLSSADATRYQMKYWNDIVGSPYKESTPWNPTTLSAVYPDSFTQGEGTHYFAFSACNAGNAADNCSAYSSPFIVTYDNTAPTQTISGIDISADTGISNSDFLTNTASQTITATLSSGLSASDILFGSVNNGANWLDILNKVLGTAITWDGATLSGSSSIAFKVKDLANNEGTTATQSYVLDTTVPAVPGNPDPADQSYVNTHDFTFSWDTVSDLSTPISYEWEFSYGTAVEGDGSFTSRSGFHSLASASVNSPGTPDNIYYWHVRAIDSAGNKSAWASPWKVTVDNIKPASVITTFGLPNGASVTTSSWNGRVDGTALDDRSGVNHVKLIISRTAFDPAVTEYWDGSAWQGGSTTFDAVGSTIWSYQLPGTIEEGTYQVTSHAIDNASNEETTYSITIIYDKSIPEVTLAIDPVNPEGDNNWYLTNPTITLTANDNFNVDRIEYQLDSTGGSWLTYNGPIKLDDGNWKFYYRSIDKAGNISDAGLKNVKVDTQDPDNVNSFQAEYRPGTTDVRLTWNVNDNDTKKVYIYRGGSRTFTVNSGSRIVINDNNDESYNDNNVNPGQTYFYKAVARDDAGNNSSASVIKIVIPEGGTAPAVSTALGTEAVPEGTILGTETNTEGQPTITEEPQSENPQENQGQILGEENQTEKTQVGLLRSIWGKWWFWLIILGVFSLPVWLFFRNRPTE